MSHFHHASRIRQSPQTTEEWDLDAVFFRDVVLVSPLKDMSDPTTVASVTPDDPFQGYYRFVFHRRDP